MGMVCGASCSELFLCFIPAMGEINTVGTVNIQLYLPISIFFADEVREGGNFSLIIKSQDLKNWRGRNSDIVYQQNNEGWYGNQ